MPQGSILGTTLFILFINELPLFLLNHCFADFFADDATFHTHSNNVDVIEHHLLANFSETKHWSKWHKLPINYIYKKKKKKKKKKNLHVRRYRTTTRRLL